MSFLGGPDVQIRDIKFDFNDTCNCWSSCCKDPKEKIYINHEGSVEKFDMSKANGKTFERSLDNLINTINIKATETLHMQKGSLQEFASVLKDAQEEQAITREHLEKINKIFEDEMRAPRKKSMDGPNAEKAKIVRVNSCPQIISLKEEKKVEAVQNPNAAASSWACSVM